MVECLFLSIFFKILNNNGTLPIGSKIKKISTAVENIGNTFSIEISLNV
jgi:hypothetical protein